ncbi:MAG TPA: hypothetical protein VK427_24180, partial [Kofleriaceae bacterium]|nr:hypothetical protein [Kofleriaceae bacterium]
PEALGLTTAPPAGNPDGTSCYYVTIEQLVPMPATLDLAVGDTGTLGEEIKLYSTTVPAGTVQLTWEITTPHARPAIVVSKNGALHAYDQDGTLTMSGFTTGDTALIAADHVFNYAVFPAPYRLTSP